MRRPGRGLSGPIPSLVFLVLSGGRWAAAQAVGETAGLATLSREMERIAAASDPAVVQILTHGYGQPPEAGGTAIRSQRGSGSGAIVDASGYVVTNAHVVGHARTMQLLIARIQNGKLTSRRVPAALVGLDRETDIAVLKADIENATALRFANSDGLRQGQLVFAMGSPFGLANSLSLGVVSSTGRELRQDDPVLYVQTDASINPGNSGGPLLNIRGEIVGLNTLIGTASGGSDGVGFAIPSNLVQSVYEQIRAHGRVRRGQIGVIAQTVTPEMAEGLRLRVSNGAILGDVRPKSSAEAAGLQVGDVIVTVNGREVENARQFGLEVYSHAGDTLALELVRGESTLPVRVAVLERPQDPDRVLSLISLPRDAVPALGIIALDLEKALPLVPGARRLSGVFVADATETASPAGNPLQAGDIVYSVQGETVGDVNQLRERLGRMSHGQTAVLHIERSGQLQYLVVEVQ